MTHDFLRLKRPRQIDPRCKNHKFDAINGVKRWGFNSVCCTCGHLVNKTGTYTHEQYKVQIQGNQEDHRQHCKSPLSFTSHNYHATEIDAVFVQSTTNFTMSSSTWTEETGWSIADTLFTASKQYLIIAEAQQRINSTSAHVRFRVLHDTTVFPDSTNVQESARGTSPHGQTANFITVWLQPSTRESLSVEHSTNGTNTLQTNYASIFAMNLDDDLTENTDWYSDADATDRALTTTWSTLNNASITFTPSAGDDWLVIAHSMLSPVDTTVSYGSRINTTGTFTTLEPWGKVEGEDTLDKKPMFNARVFPALGAVSQSFTQQSYCDSASSGDRENSFIFALNLDKFAAQANTWTEGEIALSTTNYATNVATTSITPTVTGPVYILGTNTIVHQPVQNHSAKMRLQVDNTTDTPASQTSNAYGISEPFDATDEIPVTIQYRGSLTNAAHTLDLDDSATRTSFNAANRSIVAFTMELAAAPPAGFAYTQGCVIG